MDVFLAMSAGVGVSLSERGNMRPQGYSIFCVYLVYALHFLVFVRCVSFQNHLFGALCFSRFVSLGFVGVSWAQRFPCFPTP